MLTSHVFFIDRLAIEADALNEVIGATSVALLTVENAFAIWFFPGFIRIENGLLATWALCNNHVV